MTLKTELIEAMAKAMCDAQTGSGSWLRANETEINYWRFQAGNALSAHSAFLTERGLKVVPLVATGDMEVKGGGIVEREFNESDWEDAKEMAECLSLRPVWHAMLDAAPDLFAETPDAG